MNVRDLVKDYASRKPPVVLKVHPDLPDTFLEAPIAHHEWARIQRPDESEEHLTCVMVLGPNLNTWVAHDLTTNELYPFGYLEQEAKLSWVDT